MEDGASPVFTAENVTQSQNWGLGAGIIFGLLLSIPLFLMFVAPNLSQMCR